MDIFIPWDNCVNEAGVATLRCVPVVFQNIVTAALMFAGVAAVFFIIIGGYKFMTSGGDPKAVESARKTAIYAIIGLVLILMSFAIVQFISISTGVKCINAFSFENCDTVESNPSAVGDYDIGNTTDRSDNALRADDIQAPNGNNNKDNKNDRNKKDNKKKNGRGGNNNNNNRR